ncbi:MAG: type IV pilin protein [Salibacteraceae bacterium]
MRTLLRRALRPDRQLSAFSLTELLVVLVIIGILVFLALPNLLPAITNARSQEAKINLKHIHTLQRNYFYQYSKYSEEFGDINYEPPKSQQEGGNAVYTYQIIEASNNSFLAEAVATQDFDGDGVFNKWQIDQDEKITEVVKD